MAGPRPLTLPAGDVAVSAVLHPSDGDGPGVLLTHGAGGNLDDVGLVALAEGLAGEGAPTIRANLPFREAGAGRPPRADRAVPGFRALAVAARDHLGAGRFVVGGKSYGGRVASLAVAAGVDADGLLFYGYPLHPPGKPERLRVDHWPDVAAPCLFLQGTRDPMCDLDLLDANLRKLARRATVHVVDGGDHSLRITKAASDDGRVHHPAEVLAELAREVVVPWFTTIA